MPTEPEPDPMSLEALLARRQAMLEHLTERVANPPIEAWCSPCSNGKHDKCKTDAYHELEKKRVPCTCPMRSVEGHP